MEKKSNPQCVKHVVEPPVEVMKQLPKKEVDPRKSESAVQWAELGGEREGGNNIRPVS